MSTDTNVSVEQIRRDLQQPGVEAGQVVMLHVVNRSLNLPFNSDGSNKSQD